MSSAAAMNLEHGSGKSFDVIVVGGGHNGLVCAGYLTREGFSVVVVEQKTVVGGCVVTEEAAPGWRINTYGMEHYVIQNTPILADLSLARHGLRYYSLEPTVFSPFRDGRYMLFHRKVQKTISHIARFSKKDARAYEKFHAGWSPVMRAIGMASLSGPASLEGMLSRARMSRADESGLRRADMEHFLQLAELPASKILEETFETDYVSSPIAFLGPAAVGQSPASPGTGWLLGWHLGAERVGRPVGGAGALTQSLSRMVESRGGTVITDDRVVRITVTNGRASGVETSSGRKLRSRVVVSNADPKQTLLNLLDSGDPLGSSEKRRVRGIKVSAGIAFKADYLLSGLPRYASTRSRRAAGAATFIAPSVRSLARAYQEFSSGENPREPALMVALHSATDPSLAPPGKHGLLLETRYTPYSPGGKRWTKAAATAEALRLLELFEDYAPGASRMVERVRPISPPDMERDVLIPRGNFMHADMTIDQMFGSRPARGLLDGYSVSSVPGLYLCGAGTFPGGAISGIPGRNAALQIISDLAARR